MLAQCVSTEAQRAAVNDVPAVMRVCANVGQSLGAYEHVLLQKRSRSGAESLLSARRCGSYRRNWTGRRLVLVLGGETVRLFKRTGYSSCQRERRSLHAINLGEQSLLWCWKSTQQKRKNHRGSQLSTGGQYIRTISEQRVTTVTGEREYGFIATAPVIGKNLSGTLRCIRFTATGVIIRAAFGYRVDGQRSFIDRFSAIIQTTELPLLRLHARMGRTLIDFDIYRLPRVQLTIFSPPKNVLPFPSL